jgi:hypothetical protein
MRFLLFAATVALGIAQPAVRPAIVMSVWYNGPRISPPQSLPATASYEILRSDLVAVRRAGFNGITSWISWREGEPRRGVLDVAPLDRLIRLAIEVGLHVEVQVYTNQEPAWKKDGTNALAGAFYEQIRDYYSERRNSVTVRFAASPTGVAPSSVRIGPQPAGIGAREARLEIWSEFVRGNRSLSFLGETSPLSPDMRAVGETAAVLTSNQALFAPLTPRAENGNVHVDPAGGIDARILESADAIVLVALNHSTRTRRVKLTFPPDIPEAIWQNMEAGNAVNFVVGADGPFYDHTFAPQDALVLAIRKRLR